MDILGLIKKHRAIRKYTDEQISKRIIRKIVDAGIWSSSVHGFQPWKFIVIQDKNLILNISNILLKKSQRLGAGVNILLHSSSDTIANAPTLIIVYDTGIFTTLAKKFRKFYTKVAYKSEMSAISAAIQNMILVADSFGISSCWLAMPQFCKKEINKLILEANELVAIVTLGYPAEKGKRSKRVSTSGTIRYIK